MKIMKTGIRTFSFFIWKEECQHKFVNCQSNPAPPPGNRNRRYESGAFLKQCLIWLIWKSDWYFCCQIWNEINGMNRKMVVALARVKWKVLASAGWVFAKQETGSAAAFQTWNSFSKLAIEQRLWHGVVERLIYEFRLRSFIQLDAIGLHRIQLLFWPNISFGFP